MKNIKYSKDSEIAQWLVYSRTVYGVAHCQRALRGTVVEWLVRSPLVLKVPGSIHSLNMGFLSVHPCSSKWVPDSPQSWRRR